MEEQKNKATLYLNMIIGDFEPVEIVKRSLDSVKDAVDGMYITITHKEDAPKEDHPLVKLLTEYKASISYFKWTYNFAEARQFALDQVPRGADKFIYWQDADDVLHGAERLKDALQAMVNTNAAAIYFDYWYQVDLDEEGNVREILVKHKRERIVRNDDTWKWIGDLHETLIEQKQENILKITDPSFDDIYVIHLTNGDRLDKNIDRNVEILEEAVKKTNRKDPRPIIYLAKAYFDQAKMVEMPERKIKFDLALTLFHEYLAGSGSPGEAGYQEPSGWKEERSTAWSYIAEIAILTGHPEIAVGAYQSAIDEAPWFPNYYVDLAMAYVMIDDYRKAEHWLNVASSVPDPKTTIIQFPRELKSRALEVSFHVNMNKNNLQLAMEDAERLCQLLPKDEMAKKRLQTVTSLWYYNKACQSFIFIGKYLEQIKELDKIPHLVQAIPAEMQQEKFSAEMKHLFLPPKIWADNEVAIVCGPGFEKWDANSIKTGLGGSEEAVVYLSKALNALGWKVTVYANPEKPGNFDGVEYKVWHDVNPKDLFNTLILWRSIGFVDLNPKARFTMVWMHDVPNNPDFTEERVAKVDKIAVLSEYHKSLLRLHKNGLYEKMPEEKVFLTSNGLPDIDVKPWKGNPHRMIYSSSADRGLIYLLKNWDKIRKEVPDAELHIFYGWQVYDIAHRDNPARQQWKEKVMKMMKQDGIIYHGRVGHDALHYEMSKSGIWAYPTDFTEISCITAMKAQKLGAIPVVTDYAALTETVKNGLRIDVDITTEEGQTEYFDALIGLLKDEKKQEEIRTPMMKWADHYFDWSNVAKLWDERIRVELQNPERKLLKLNDDKTGTDGRPQDAVDGSKELVSALRKSVLGKQQEQGTGRPSGDTSSDRTDKLNTGDSERREERPNTTTDTTTDNPIKEVSQ